MWYNYKINKSRGGRPRKITRQSMLKERLLEDLKNCMKDKNVVRKNVIQMVRAAILQVEKDKQITLDDNQIIDIIAKESKKRKDSLADYEKRGFD